MDNESLRSSLNSDLTKLNQIIEALEDLILSRAAPEKAQACKTAQIRLVDASNAAKVQLSILKNKSLLTEFQIVDKTLQKLARDVGFTWQDVLVSVAADHEQLIASWQHILSLYQKTSQKLKQLDIA